MNNENQEKAISHQEGPCIVIAPPGSGKTYVIMNRIRYLVETCKVPSDTIYVVTFTRMAALEMRERYEKLVTETNNEVVFGTFHSVFLNIVMQETPYTRDSLLSSKDQYKLVSLALRRIGYEHEIHEELIAQITKEVSRLKNQGYQTQLMKEKPSYQCDGITEELFFSLYDVLQEERQEQKRLDFDDILLECYKLLTDVPEVLAKYQRKIQYLLVDEFQDSNPLQYHILQMLALPNNHFFTVGDDDQSIYGFRGSTPSIMQQFLIDYPNAQKIILAINYRSTPEIIEDSKRLIAQNENRFIKEYTAFQEHGDLVTYTVTESLEDQLDQMVTHIQTHLKAGEEDIAVIFRTTTQLDLYTNRLQLEQLAYQVKEKVKNIYDHTVVKDIRAYLSYTHVEQNAKDLRYILNKPNRYLSQKGISEYEFKEETLETYYGANREMLVVVKKFRTQLMLLSQMEPYAAMVYIRKAMGYERWLQEAYLEEKKYQECKSILMQLQEESKEYESVQEMLAGWIRKHDQLSNQGNENQMVGNGFIKLITMHSSKGLEFNVVLIPDIVEGNIPHRKAKKPEEIEEERRLFYVAMTRAKKKLYCYGRNEKRDNTKVVSSRFLEELHSEEKSSSSSSSQKNSSYSSVKYSSRSEFSRNSSNNSEIAFNSSSDSMYSKSGSLKISSFSK